MIGAPGIYDNIPEDIYHSDSDLAPSLGRSLSQSGAKTLLRNPARYAWERDHGRPAKDAFDVGSLTHALVLRNPDPRLRIIDAYDWRTKAAQEAKKAAREARLVVANRADLAAAAKAARAVRRDTLACAIFAKGRPEVSAYWVDPATGVTCRARYDWVRPDALVDLKTAAYGRGTSDAFGSSAASFDYPMQAAHYIDGWEILTGDRLPFLTVTVELDPPYLVTVGQYDEADLRVGRSRMRAALEEYAERESSGRWVDEPTIHTFTLPGWYGRTA